MKILRWVAPLGCAMFLSVAACQKSVLQHKLVATGGSHTVALYPDEATYLKVSHKAQEGGVTGMVGDVQKNFTAKQIDDQTPVKIISSDDNGDEVQITQGPMAGQTGFVAKQNVD
jgi:transcription antitermination factor NusG